MNNSFLIGFLKEARDTGLTTNQAVELFKLAGDAEDMAALMHLLTNAGIGGTAGLATSALSTPDEHGSKHYLRNALLGGGIGAGIGMGADALTQTPNQSPESLLGAMKRFGSGKW